MEYNVFVGKFNEDVNVHETKQQQKNDLTFIYSFSFRS